MSWGETAYGVWSPTELLSLKSLHLSNAGIASVHHHVCFSAPFPTFGGQDGKAGPELGYFLSLCLLGLGRLKLLPSVLELCKDMCLLRTGFSGCFKNITFHWVYGGQMKVSWLPRFYPFSWSLCLFFSNQPMSFTFSDLRSAPVSVLFNCDLFLCISSFQGTC